MKSILFCLFVLISLSIYPTTMNGKFLVFNYSDTTVGIKLQINTDTGTDDLGGATIIINFDTASLSFDNFPLEDYHYSFHNFSGGKYEKAAVTKVLPNQLWVNLELIADDEGIPVADINEWTDVVTVYFYKKNETETFHIEAQHNSVYWSVFDGDNKTLWSTGDFTSESAMTDKKEEINIPGSFALSQNYPNPFNPSTKINFKLKNDGDTKLILFDLLGKEIVRIIDKQLSAGSYEVEIDGSDLSSGIYIYSLEVEGKFSAVRKMVLLK